MITIYSGADNQIKKICSDEYHQSLNSFWVDNPSIDGFCGFWGGMRRLISQIRVKFGEDLLDDAILHHRAAASLILGKLTASLNENEGYQRKWLQVRLSSHLSHNWFMQLPLLEEWATLLNRIFSVHKSMVIVPNIYNLDAYTLTTILTFYRMFPASNLDLIIGYPTNEFSRGPDSNGIVWDDLTVESYQKTLMNLKSLEHSTLVELPQSDLPSHPDKDIQIQIDSTLDDGIDYQAYNLLIDTSSEFDTLRTNLVLDAMFRAFQNFDFRVALDLGIRILQRCQNLSEQQKSFVHGTIGLSAHNRQFGSDHGNEQFNQFLEYHFRQALEFEENSTIRTAYYYRLIVTLARRKKEMEPALLLVQQVLGELHTYNLPAGQATLQEAWLRNIQAYIYAQNGNSDLAISEIERAYKLAETITPTDDISLHELTMTTSVMADNRTILALFADDLNAQGYWLQQGHKMVEQNITGARFISIASLDFYFEILRIDLALAAGHRGYRDACRHFDAYWQKIYLFYLSNFYYRIGELTNSKEYLEKLMSLSERLDSTDKQSSTRLMLAIILLRQNKLEQAEVVLETLTYDIFESSPPYTQAELLCLRAVSAAQRGDQEKAELLSNEAIDIAVESGDRDTLLMVANRSGQACHLLGNTEDALQAFNQAIQIAATSSSESVLPSYTEIADAHLGILEYGLQDEGFMLATIDAIISALQENADAWWHLPKLLPILSESLDQGQLEASKLTMLEPILTTASQRPDCVEPLHALSSRLPSNLRHYIFSPANYTELEAAG